MSPSRATIARRLGAVAAGVVLIGSAYTGVAFADEGSGGGSQPSDPVSGIVNGVTGGGSSGTSQDSSGSGSGSTGSSSEPGSGSSSSSSGSSSSPGSISVPSLPLPTDALTPESGSSATGLLGPNALISIPSSITSFPSFPTTLPSIPGLGDLSGQPVEAACSQVVGALSGLDPTGLSSALQSPAATFCGALGFTLPSLPGTTTTSGPNTEIIYASPQYYGSGKSYTGSKYWDSGNGHRYCSCSTGGGSKDSPVSVTQVTTMPKGGVDTGDGSYGP